MFSTLKKKICQKIFSIRINSEAFPIISDGTLENTSPVLIRKLCGSSAMSTNHFTNCLDFVSFSLLSAFFCFMLKKENLFWISVKAIRFV